MAEEILWAEVDLKAIAHNVCELRRITNSNSRLMAVVKANGYGHGSVEVARCALDNSAEMLGVARIHEAILLRNEGIDAPILVLGHTPTFCYEDILNYDIIQTLFSRQAAESLSSFAVSHKKKVKVHVKIDTGMGRLGILVGRSGEYENWNGRQDYAMKEVESIIRLPGLEPEGIFTHFSMADNLDKSFSRRQFEIFMEFINSLKGKGIEFGVKHAANSAGIIDMPETHLDMVRAGIAMYGLYPSEEVKKEEASLIPAMTVKSMIVHLKDVPAGFKVSYGATYETKKPTTIATVPVGYADGYNRLLSSRGYMLVCGEKMPIVGRICMDLTMLDVGNTGGVKQGDEVVILGKQKDSEIKADEIASLLGTINYEVVSSLTERVKRVYIR
ncbi:MAG: alanine racemase [Pseudomonadota bacterium]|nr:alanine racemase [Pseudomonadota bacterium]MBU1398039.1 alanine racemase [Pseudomonadota bacterium]MBU1571074.1 alanine racemase [Pseudomonadota bacterium]